MDKPEILITKGPLAGRRFTVQSADGLRLGRSSSCEIAVADPALSRNHCLFEWRDDALWVTDLASANGTYVNDALLDVESVKLSVGDVVSAGDTLISVVQPGADPMPQAAAPAPVVDLGLGHKDAAEASSFEDAGTRPSPIRLILWGVAGIAVLIAICAVLFAPAPDSAANAVKAIRSAADTTLLAVTFEKVEASTANLYRYALSYSSDGTLQVQFDDVPKENRHLKRTVKLNPEARKRLGAIFANKALYALEPSYAGAGAAADAYAGLRLKVVRGDRVFETSAENVTPPDVLRDVCNQLEAFSKNELGTWALQYSAEKLVALSAQSRKAGDAKWAERDVEYGNLAAAIAAYDEAVVYLDTVNPKPEGYQELLAQRDTARQELDKRYRDQRFQVDRAVNLGDWAAARRELRVLCDLVPDERDPRHAEAQAKLVDVEARQQKGARK